MTNIIRMAQPECSHHYVRDEEAVKHYCCQKCGTVKVEQPEQEPVAWLVEFENGEQELHFDKQSVGETQAPLYTTPPAAQPCPYIRSTAEGTHHCALANQTKEQA
jgi:hypothetical protein